MSDAPEPPPTRETASLPLAVLATLAERLAETRSRLELTRLVGDFLRSAPAADRSAAARLLVGRHFPEGDPRRLDVNALTIWRVVVGLTGEAGGGEFRAGAGDFGQAVKARLSGIERIVPPPLTVREIARAFDVLSAQRGRGSQTERENLLRALFERASAPEGAFLARTILGEMRHGVSEGLMAEAIASAAALPHDTVRRAALFLGDVGEVADRAFESGLAALASAGPRLFRPLKPMLAQAARSLEEVWAAAPERLGMEFKLDGLRIQIHVERDEVRLFSRRLHDVTDSLPDVVAEVRGSLAVRRAILEGEVIAIDAGGRPRSVHATRHRLRQAHLGTDSGREISLRLYLFDLLLDDDEVLLDRPYRERWVRLLEAHGGLPLVPRCVPRAFSEAKAFWMEALEAGHEGVIFKRLESPYTPGLRGSGWFKLKQVDRLDLVIVAAEYGEGRRRNWLTTYHLAARDEETGEFRRVGKTVKEPGEEDARGLTARLQALKRHEEAGVVWVEPRIVVAVRSDGLQRSPREPDGMTLRAARLEAVRDDKPPGDADTLQHLRRLLAAPQAAPEAASVEENRPAGRFRGEA